MKYNLTDEDIDFLFDFVKKAMMLRYLQIEANPHLTEKAKLGFKKDSLLFYEKDNKAILDQLKSTIQQVTILPQLEEMDVDLSPPPPPSDNDAFEKRM